MNFAPPPGIPEYVREVFRSAPAGVDVLAMLAGGALRAFFDGTPVKDYDLFFCSMDDYDTARWLFTRDPRFFEPGSVETPPNTRVFRDATTGREWNLVGFDFQPTLGALVMGFDFTCCAMAAEIVSADGSVEFCAAEHAVEDALRKVLRPQTKKPLPRTIARIRRYRRYGYRLARPFFRAWAACPEGRGGY